ncbi:hypothetical protein [Caballeronia sp. BR00000012568055]|uniref:hypothetical protein n=1 Tax=Caballeronia sp. BR00000012568055 TaxID=2918761 RepID=UPI0023F6D2BE|nr:hypothetical protein [Caballeronia sp. BR00000012568055]
MQDGIDRELLKTLRDMAHVDSLAYQFESFKHLAIANGAGLALCAGIMASKSEGVATVTARVAMLCALGLVIAIALLVWRWIWGTRVARGLLDLYLAAETRTVSRAEVAALALSRRWAWIPYALAGLSLVCFFLAVYIASLAVR